MRHLARTAPALVRACHPQPTLAVTAVAAGLAVTSGRTAEGVVLVAAAILAGQLSVGWLNDLVDADRDAAVGRAGKPVAAQQLSRKVVLAGVLAAAAGAMLLSLPSGLPATAVHLAALVSAWSYDLGLKAGALSVLPYTVSFGLLPAFVVLGLPGSPLPPVWLVAAGALLGTGAHFANVLPDMDDDLATGVRGLPHRLGATGSRAAATGLVLGASVVLVLGPSGEATGTGLLALLVAVLAITAGLFRALRPGSRSVFQALLVVAVIDVALLLAGGVGIR